MLPKSQKGTGLVGLTKGHLVILGVRSYPLHCSIQKSLDLFRKKSIGSQLLICCEKEELRTIPYNERAPPPIIDGQLVRGK